MISKFVCFNIHWNGKFSFAVRKTADTKFSTAAANVRNELNLADENKSEWMNITLTVNKHKRGLVLYVVEEVLRSFTPVNVSV